MDHGSETLSVAQLRELRADPEALERPVTEHASPLVMVHLGDGEGWDRLPAVRPTTPRVFLGWAEHVAADAPAPEAFDVLLTGGDTEPPGWVRTDDPAGTVGRIAAACATTPQAATTLVEVLRLGSRLDVEEAVAAESFAYSMLLAGPEFAAWVQAQPPREHRPADQPVLVSDDGTTVTITLNRPDVHHAYDAATRDALVGVLRALVSLPEPPLVLLRSTGPSFCSGGDLSQFGTTRDPVTAHGIRTSRAPGLLLHALGDRAGAVVHGSCVGAGIELPAFCARVLATPDATFRLPEVAMGLIPGAGGTASIPARIGRHRTAYLALAGDTIPAPTALRWGLVDAVVDRDEAGGDHP
ncbi:MAG: enoyl-CoA hydratase/isomerase family protein [Acidimicrobiia bacterium]|nr:enoyl-CoA hydratase/isomerase family protein [Acidimicrobiia bacterium]